MRNNSLIEVLVISFQSNHMLDEIITFIVLTLLFKRFISTPTPCKCSSTQLLPHSEGNTTAIPHSEGNTTAIPNPCGNALGCFISLRFT